MQIEKLVKENMANYEMNLKQRKINIHAEIVLKYYSRIMNIRPTNIMDTI